MTDYAIDDAIDDSCFHGDRKAQTSEQTRLRCASAGKVAGADCATLLVTMTAGELEGYWRWVIVGWFS